MTFQEYIDGLGKELGIEMETEGDASAVTLGSMSGDSLDILMQGFEERGMLLTCADLGEPPPEGRERLYQALLEANDLRTSSTPPPSSRKWALNFNMAADSNPSAR